MYQEQNIKHQGHLIYEPIRQINVVTIIKYVFIKNEYKEKRYYQVL